MVGPRDAPVPFLYFNLTNPNGSFIDQRYVQVINGTANFSFLLPLVAPEGNYLLNVSSNSTLVAQVGLKVVFDELNYLSKRVALLEQRNEDLARRIEVQRIQNRDQQATLDALIWLYLWVLFWTLLTIAAIRFCIEPVWMHWQNLKADFDPEVTRKARFLNWATSYYGPSERAFYNPTLRLMGPDPTSVARVSELSRTQHPYALDPPRPVRKSVFQRRRGP